jgi:hypothetical protein
VCAAGKGLGKIRHAGAHRAETEGPSRILFQFDSLGRCTLDRSLDGVDRRVEVALGDLHGRFLGLTDLFGDALVLGQKIWIVLSLVANDRRPLLVFPGVGSNVSQDTHLVDGWVILGVDPFQFRMQGFVAGPGQAGIALVDLDVGISLLERNSDTLTYLRYV